LNTEKHLSARPRIVHRQFPDGGYGNASRQRIFDTDDVRGDRRVHLAFFKGKIRIAKLAIDQAKIFAIAKGLCAADLASDQGKIFGIPPDVLSAQRSRMPPAG